MKFFEGETLNLFASENEEDTKTMTEDEINEKYARGEIRIVTEQARYPLPTIVTMLESKRYELNPEFQRRHRWNNTKKSKLIESFIMNVPIPPIFLYEIKYSFYEVMDGLQRLTAIFEFYKDEYELIGLEEWPELNGYKYSTLPEQVKAGVDRRYLSSIILLQETAKKSDEAEKLKQSVFERLNSGGIKLEPQESRNAIYNGPLNRLCIKLARNIYLCKTWKIPEPTSKEIQTGKLNSEAIKSEIFRKMDDVELVLRFFAYRHILERDAGPLKDYFDYFLKQGNTFKQSVLDSYEALFNETIKLAYDTFGEKAFWLWRKKNDKWSQLKRPTVVVYDPMMYALSQYTKQANQIIDKRAEININLKNFYQAHYASFAGRDVNKSNIEDRNNRFIEFFSKFVDK